MKDLFETPELIPHEVQAVLDTFSDEASSYWELERILNQVEKLGYTFEYGLDAEPFNLRKIEEI
jgi:hypothetical protein